MRARVPAGVWGGAPHTHAAAPGLDRLSPATLQRFSATPARHADDARLAKEEVENAKFGWFHVKARGW